MLEGEEQLRPERFLELAPEYGSPPAWAGGRESGGSFYRGQDRSDCSRDLRARPG
jgi:hypothetical protein